LKELCSVLLLIIVAPAPMCSNLSPTIFSSMQSTGNGNAEAI
jgi:hypothetical protein